MNAATLDTTTLLAGLQSCDKAVQAATERGAGRAGSRLLNLASTKPPTTPKDKGDLRAAGSVSVNGKHVQGPDNGVTMPPEPGSVTVEVGFNTPYAAYQHEGVRMDGTHKVENYTTAGSGKKFLETPLLEDADDLMHVAAAEIAKALG